MAILLVKTEDISKNTPIGGNVETSRIIPAIKSAQLTVVKPLLGKALYDKLVDDFKNGLLADSYKELYNDYVKPMLIHLSTAYYFTYGAYSIGNTGIYKATGANAEGVSKSEIDYMVKAQEKYYQNYKNSFFEFIKDADIPEYDKNETKRTKRVNYGGWSFSKQPKFGEATSISKPCGDSIWTNIEW